MIYLMYFSILYQHLLCATDNCMHYKLGSALVQVCLTSDFRGGTRFIAGMACITRMGIPMSSDFLLFWTSFGGKGLPVPRKCQKVL